MENMTEKEFEELLKQQTEEIPVPDSLSPENMVKRIKMDRGSKWMKEGKWKNLIASRINFGNGCIVFLPVQRSFYVVD